MDKKNKELQERLPHSKTHKMNTMLVKEPSLNPATFFTENYNKNLWQSKPIADRTKNRTSG